MRKISSTLIALATLAALPACGSGGSSPVEAATCTYDFEATVREGPSAPFQTEGVLVVATDSDGHMAGVYRPYDATSVDDLLVPDVAVSDGMIELGFHTQGGTILGSGVVAAGDECEGTLLGDLTGPGDGDAGDWDGVLIDGERVELHTVERHPAPAAGAAATEVAIGVIDIGPEPTPDRDGGDLDPSSLDTFESLPRTGTLGNTLVDAFVADDLEYDGPVGGNVPDPFPPSPPRPRRLKLSDLEEKPAPDDDCEPDELGDGECIQ
jgi:hypothetical protein